MPFAPVIPADSPGALRGFDARADLPRITAPSLIAASRDDLLVPYAASEALAPGLFTRQRCSVIIRLSSGRSASARSSGLR